MTTTRIPGYDAWKLRAPEDDRRAVPYLLCEVETWADFDGVESEIVVEAERDTSGEIRCFAWWHREEPSECARDPEELSDDVLERVREALREI